MRIPITRNGETKYVALERATFADVTAATRALTGAAGKARTRSSPAEQQIATRLHGIASLAKVTVHVSGGMLRVGGLPIAALQRFVNALRGLDLGAATAPGASTSARTKKANAAKNVKTAKRAKKTAG